MKATATYDIVVSADNNRYMQWQVMMFHYSCMRVMERPPIVVVHMDDDPLLPGFELIQKASGIIQLAPTLRHSGGIDYPPRNTAGALQFVHSTADYVVLCDADMVFLRPIPWAELAITPNTISYDRLNYLTPDHPDHEPQIAIACQAAGVDPMILRDPVINGGVPHVIATSRQADVSRQWLRYIDLFPVLDIPVEAAYPKYSYPKSRCLPWLSTMWAVILAMHQLEMTHLETSWCITNLHDEQPIPDLNQSETCMVHYCYDGAGFNKRSFRWDVDLEDPKFWEAEPGDQTIGGFLRDQFLGTAKYFGLAD